MNQPHLSSGFSELIETLLLSKPLEAATRTVGNNIIMALQAGNCLFSCGNGGSASDALHFAEEFVGRYRSSRRPLPAVCLNADVTALTCIGNDFGYENVFSRQVEALGRFGDILVGFTTSGNSENIIRAFSAAHARKMKTVLVSGNKGGKLQGICDFELIVPSSNGARIQEIHTLILHTWLEQVELIDWS